MRAVVSSFLGLSLLCSSAWAVETVPAPAVAPATQAATATLTTNPSSQQTKNLT